jgi:hypothetical protein
MPSPARLALLIVVITLLSGAAAAAPIPWTNPCGSVPGVFSWSNGQSDNGLFGSPIVNGTSFTFFPNNFRATTSNGSAITTTDRLSVTLEVAPGTFPFAGVQTAELGDYSITNGGHVSADAFLFLTNLDIPVNPPMNPITSMASFDRNLLPTGNESGLWNLQIFQNLRFGANGFNRMQLVLDNVLQSIGGANGTAQIEKKVQGVTITILIPEPSTAAALLLTAPLLRRRR